MTGLTKLKLNCVNIFESCFNIYIKGGDGGDWDTE